MTKWATLFAAAALTATPASAAVIVYELELVTDAPYTAFGGGPAGDLFVGTFGFDDSLVGSPEAVYDPILSENAFFLSIDINGTTFSTDTPGAILDNGLRFMGGPLLDVFFDITNPNGDHLEVRTDFIDLSSWSASDNASGSSAEGNTFGESVEFLLIPEPSSATLAGLAALILLRRRR
jgi:hypothetical protein